MVKPFYKPIDRPEREEIWYCYYHTAPEQRQKQGNSLRTTQVPISQVPDLTNDSTRPWGRQGESSRGRVRETDSRYVKLAKSGGRKNLLCYQENERPKSGPKTYKVPEWYYHDAHGRQEERELTEDEKFKKYKVTYGKRSYKTLVKSKVYQRPDYMTHLDAAEIQLALGASIRVPDRPIFGYDRHSVWKRDELETTKKLPSLAEKLEARDTSRQAADQTTGKLVKLPAPYKLGKRSGGRKFVTSEYATRCYDNWYRGAVKV